MAVSNPTRGGTAGEFGNIVNSEKIDAMAAYAVSTPFVYDLVARKGDLTDAKSYTWTLPIFSEIAVAASVADGAEPAPVALANTQAQITAAMYMQHVFIGYQSRGVTVWDEIEVAVNRVVHATKRKIDTDVLGLATSITATQGSAATVNTFDNVISVISAFRASAKEAAGSAILMHTDAMRDFIQDLAGSVLVTSERGAGAVANLTANGMQGPKRLDVLGMPAIESDRMPVGDTTGWTNAIVELGSNAPLCLAFRRNASLDGVAMLGDGGVPIHVEMLKSDTSPGHYIRAWSHHGVGISEQARAVNFITRT